MKCPLETLKTIILRHLVPINIGNPFDILIIQQYVVETSIAKKHCFFVFVVHFFLFFLCGFWPVDLTHIPQGLLTPFLFTLRTQLINFFGIILKKITTNKSLLLFFLFLFILSALTHFHFFIFTHFCFPTV